MTEYMFIVTVLLQQQIKETEMELKIAFAQLVAGKNQAENNALQVCS